MAVEQLVEQSLAFETCAQPESLMLEQLQGSGASLDLSPIATTPANDVESNPSTPLAKEQPSAAQPGQVDLVPEISDIESGLGELLEEWKDKPDVEGKPVLMSQLREAMETGEFPKSDKTLQNVFYRSHKPGSEAHKKLKACKTWAEKRAYTKTWCKDFYEHEELSQTHGTSFKKVDKNKGEYMCFGMLVESFGIQYNRELAIKKATIHATKCCKMAGDWVNYDSMSETMEFLKIKKQYNEIMEESWGKFQKQYGKKDETQNEEAPAPDAPEKHKSAAAKAKAAKAEAKKKAEAAKAAEATKTEGQQKRTATAAGLGGGNGGVGSPSSAGIRDLCKKATALKTRLTSTRSRAKEILEMIAAEANGWDWAKGNKRNDGRLSRDLKMLNDNVDDFAQVFLTEDLKDIKEKYGAEHLHCQLEKFLKLDTCVSDLETTLKTMLGLHKQANATVKA